MLLRISQAITNREIVFRSDIYARTEIIVKIERTEIRYVSCRHICPRWLLHSIQAIHYAKGV